jgi:hypothetical protein
MGNGPVTNVIVTCSTNAYTVGGTISGLSGGTLTLLNNGGDAISKTANGSFTFPTPIPQGGSYNVAVQLPQPANQTCSVSNGSGTMGNGPVTNVIVTCSTNAYTVGGTISGLSGGTLTLLNNGGDAISKTANGSFTFPTPIPQGGSYNVTVQLPQPTGQICLISNGSGPMGSSPVTNVSVSCSAISPTTITVSPNGIIPYTGSTLSQDLTVTNTGSSPAYNVSAMLPTGWTGVAQNSTGCASIAPSGTCTLSFTSTTAYVAQGGIVVSGNNTTSPTTALAFSVGGYLVWQVSGTTVQVIDTTDLSSGQEWGGFGTAIGPGAQSFTNGSSSANTLPSPDNVAGNTAAIVTALGTNTSYAARSCYEKDAGNNWYLPAICQMGGSGGNANCSSGLANIDTNLVQLGFGGLAGFYWSSTEYSLNPQLTAWHESFASGGSVQDDVGKGNQFGVRCSRALSL